MDLFFLNLILLHVSPYTRSSYSWTWVMEYMYKTSGQKLGLLTYQRLHGITFQEEDELDARGQAVYITIYMTWTPQKLMAKSS